MIKKTKLLKVDLEITFEGKPRILEVEYGIHYIKANSDAYFAITGTVYKTKTKKSFVASGCIHDIIKKNTRDFDDFIALHLSDTDGVPSYAVENGFYYAKNPCKYPPEVLAKHLRIPTWEARGIYGKVADGFMTKAKFSEYVGILKPQWKEEAQAALKKIGVEYEEVQNDTN